MEKCFACLEEERDVVISIKENNTELEIYLCKKCYKKHLKKQKAIPKIKMDFCSFCKTKKKDSEDKKLYNYYFEKDGLINFGRMCINCKEEGKFQDTKETWEFRGWKEIHINEEKNP